MFLISYRNKDKIFGGDRKEDYNTFMKKYPEFMYEIFMQ
jgi:hypothetical protein